MNQESLKIKKREPSKKTIKQPNFEYSSRPLVIVIIFPHTNEGKKMAFLWYSEFQKHRSKIAVTNYIYMLFEVYGQANLGYLFNCGFQIPNIFDFNVIFHSPYFIPSSTSIKYYNLYPKIPIIIDNSNYMTIMISQQHFEKIKGFSVIEETPLALKINLINQLLTQKLAIHILNKQEPSRIKTSKKISSQQTILPLAQSSKIVHISDCLFSFFYIQTIGDDNIYYLGTQCQLFKNPELSFIPEKINSGIGLEESLQKIKETEIFRDTFWRNHLKQGKSLFNKIIQQNNLESTFLNKYQLLSLPIDKIKEDISILSCFDSKYNTEKLKNKRILFIQSQNFLGKYLDKYYLWINKRWVGLSSSDRVDYLLVNKEIEKESKIKLGIKGNVYFYEVSYSSLKVWNKKYDFIINGQYFQQIQRRLFSIDIHKFIQEYNHSLFTIIGQNLKLGGTFQSFLFIPSDYQQLYQLELLSQLFENQKSFIFKRPYLSFRVHLKNYQPENFMRCFQRLGSSPPNDFKYSLGNLVSQLAFRCQDLLNFWKFIYFIDNKNEKGKLKSTMSCGILSE